MIVLARPVIVWDFDTGAARTFKSLFQLCLKISGAAVFYGSSKPLLTVVPAFGTDRCFCSTLLQLLRVFGFCDQGVSETSHGTFRGLSPTLVQTAHPQELRQSQHEQSQMPQLRQSLMLRLWLHHSCVSPSTTHKQNSQFHHDQKDQA